MAHSPINQRTSPINRRTALAAAFRVVFPLLVILSILAATVVVNLAVAMARGSEKVAGANDGTSAHKATVAGEVAGSDKVTLLK